MPSLVDIANERVSVVSVLRELGVQCQQDEGKFKTDCPFMDVYHPGKRRTLVVYPTNSAYCFHCQEANVPVSFWAKAREIKWPAAAQQLLDKVGYRPVSLLDQWDELERELPKVDKSSLAEALKTFCRRIEPDWDLVSLMDEEIKDRLDRCLSLLPNVETAEQVDTWLRRTKQVMQNVLNDRRSHDTEA